MSMRSKILAGLNLALILLSTKANAQQAVPLQITKVVDGDTVHGLVGQAALRVRLNCIDAPESYDQLGLAATNALKQIVKDKAITVVITGTDLYGRKLGTLYADGNSVQAQMTTQGLAFYYGVKPKSCPDLQLIINGENYAHSNKINMWGIAGYVAPWQQRKVRRLLINSPSLSIGLNAIVPK
jgi:micrococcal nuclease